MRRPGGQGSGRGVFEGRIPVGESVTVVAPARAAAFHFVRAQRSIEDAAVGQNARVSQRPVLLERRVRDAGEAVPGDPIAGQQNLDAVRDLLEDVGLPVRDVEDHVPPGCVDRRLIARQAERFPG